LGTDAAGRPYYAMRLVRGETLKAAIEQFYATEEQPERRAGAQALEFRKLLGRFIDVCHAVAYAHSRGILHRDLKPANILLGADSASNVRLGAMSYRQPCGGFNVPLLRRINPLLPWGSCVGGEHGNRGYLVQTITALLESLSDKTWEPGRWRLLST